MESKAVSNAVLSKKDTASSTRRTHCSSNQICNEKNIYTWEAEAREFYDLSVSTGCTSNILLRDSRGDRKGRKKEAGQPPKHVTFKDNFQKVQCT